MNTCEEQIRTFTPGVGVAVLLMAGAMTSGCLTPGQTRDVHSQLQEIRRQVDQLQVQQEHSRQAVDDTLARAESAGSDAGSGVAHAASSTSPVPSRQDTSATPPAGNPNTGEPTAASGEQAEGADLREADELYRRGDALYHRRDYTGAEQALRAFLRLVPGSPRADNARYWIGETYYARGLYREAIVEFTRVVNEYPRGNKAAHALYKIALSHERLGEGSLARVNLEALIGTYPESDVAPLARERLRGR